MNSFIGIKSHALTEILARVLTWLYALLLLSFMDR